MRAVLWLMALFGVATAIALFAAGNPGTVTLFWPPWRIDLSLNLVLLVWVLGFLVLHLALRGFAAFASIPAQARRWRAQQRERLVHASLVDALAHLAAGRFVRSRKAAENALALHRVLDAQEDSARTNTRLQAMLHLLAAESAHALQDRSRRDEHFQRASDMLHRPEGASALEGFFLRAARWALDDHDAGSAMKWLDRLPQGAARRTVALRLRFRVARMQGKTALALETLRLLIKHNAFAKHNGVSLVRALALELIFASKQPSEIIQAWSKLDPAERAMPEVALGAARHWLTLGGDAAQSRAWLLPVWLLMVEKPSPLTPAQRLALVRTLESGLGAQNDTPDATWLERVEAAQLSDPRDTLLQYLAGVMCVRLGLWGKAQHLLRQSAALSADLEVKRDAQRALDALAHRGN